MLPFFGTRPTEQPLPVTVGSAKELGEDNKVAILRCVCSAEVSDVNHIISRGFTGHFGRAILVQHAYNIAATEEFERMLATGRHIICDVLCQACGLVIGWKYLAAPVGQEYKLGNYILESQRVRKQNVGW